MTKETSTSNRVGDEALKEDEKAFRMLFDAIPVGVAVLQRHVFQRVNAEFCAITGYSSDELVGASPRILYGNDDEARPIMEALYRMIGQNGAGMIEAHFQHKDGRMLDVLVNVRVNDPLDPDTGTVVTLLDITERRHAEKSLRESEKRMLEIINFLPDATFAIDRDGTIIAWNRAIEEITGYKSEDMLGKGNYEYALPFYGIRRPCLIDFVLGSHKEIEEKYSYIKREGNYFVAEATLSLKGKERIFWGKVARLLDSLGNISGAIEILRDVTEIRQAEKEQTTLREQLYQSQKMETVGLLAGGVAHDFNNLLTPVIGYSEFMKLSLPEGSPDLERVEHVLHAAELMKGLTSRLLAFSRKQVLDLKVINIGAIIRGFERMTHRVIRENIEIRIILESQLGMVSADRGQIEQVLLNLAVNAQDAMPEGGILTIEARNADLDEVYTTTHPEVMPGSYVMFSVSDTGTGMDEETQEHLFEPFFTTKEVGKGTGLGLATVYGIIKQHGGSVSAYSEKNQGATFKVLLPRVIEEGKKIREEIESHSEQLTHGNETVLVVEDDEPVRVFTCRMLQDLGYRVLTAEDVDRCIEMANKHPGDIDLLLTDVIMPKKNGKEVYQLIHRERPQMKVLFISGYTGDILGQHDILDQGVNFLQKPFTLKALSQKVRSVLSS